MKPFFIFLFSYFFLTVVGRMAMAQQAGERLTDSLTKKFEFYRLKKQEGILYAHFDKTIYTNNENVWFTAYLLADNSRKKSDVLSAMLVKDDDHKIVLEAKFIMAGGLSFGNVFLPDTIAAGDYSFMLYTNNVSQGKPADVFVQPVTIKNTSEISFAASLDLVDTSRFPADGKRKILLVTNSRGPKIISGAAVNYCLGNKTHPLAKGTVKTDKAGQYLFNLPVQYVDVNNNIMEVQVTYGKETRNIKLLLPVYPSKQSVRFYPEGGNLSDGLRSAVGWEVKNEAGNPCKVTGVLYRGGDAIDTIATNSYGMGKFTFVPQKGNRYYVKLLLAEAKDAVYNLPEVRTYLPVISIPHAVADDTLKLLITNKMQGRFNVLVHDYNQLFFSFPAEVNSLGRPVKIILNNVPKGIAEVTILDSLQRPCAERLFFAHYKHRNSLKVSTDQGEYKTRQLVHLNLDLLDAGGKPAGGLVSIACIQANRLELKKSKYIESYFYLEHELGAIPVTGSYLGTAANDVEYLEDVLLIKGWRRYTWKELLATTPADTLTQQDSLMFAGDVTYFDRPLKKSLTMLEMKDSLVKTISTFQNGHFRLENSDLYTAADKKIYLFASGNSNDGYNINLKDPYTDINKRLSQSIMPLNYNRFTNEKNDGPENLSGLEHVIHLREVRIKGENDNSIYGSENGNSRVNACGDYVCKFNILNCPNHRDDPDNRAPVKGQIYTYLGSAFYTYEGCEITTATGFRKAFDGINYASEFYPADYLQYNPSSPEYVSTIYWKHLYKIIPGKDTGIKFYTSDITGTFKIVVQGVGADDVIFAEKTFVVKKP